jgi:hypothetical protein
MYIPTTQLPPIAGLLIPEKNQRGCVQKKNPPSNVSENSHPARVARFFYTQSTKTGKINTTLHMYLPNGLKMYQMAVKYFK